MLRDIAARQVRNLQPLVESIFTAPTDRTSVWVGRAWLATLFVGGALLWGLFLNWGRIPMTYHDWARIYGPRTTFVRSALIEDEVPLHMSNTIALGEKTDRFMSIPDQILSPQVLLLRFLEIGPFFLVHILLLYSAGFAGLVYLGQKYGLSPFAITVFFLLFNLNGHILSHISVGHATWGGYFLLPWFVSLVLALVEKPRGWGWVAGMALLLFAIFLQGSYHQFVWALLFLAFLAIAFPARFWRITTAAVFAVLLSAVRILPPALIYSQFTNQYLGGYPTLQMVWTSMTEILLPGDITWALGMPKPIGMWEFDLYLGLTGAVFLLIFGVYRWLTCPGASLTRTRLMFPCLALLVLSLTQMYKWARLTGIPLLEGERISSRLISVALVFVIFFAVLELQRWLGRASWPARMGGLLLLVVLGHDLWQNFKVWAVTNASGRFPFIDFVPDPWVVDNHYNDHIYIQYILAGLAISLVSLAVLLFLYSRERKQSLLPAVIRTGHSQAIQQDAEKETL